jgi:hypothetical protein
MPGNQTMLLLGMLGGTTRQSSAMSKETVKKILVQDLGMRKLAA